MVSNDPKELEELEKEVTRLQKLVDKYEKESQVVINKASHLKERETTANMQTLELFRLNAYLISHLPDSDRILEEYLQTKSDNSLQSSVSTGVSNKKQLVSKPFKSPVTPVSSYLKPRGKLVNEEATTSKNNGYISGGYTSDNDKNDDSSYTSIRRKSPRKGAPQQRVSKSSDEDDSIPPKRTPSKPESNKGVATSKSASKSKSPTDKEKNASDKSKSEPKKRGKKNNDKDGEQDKPKRKRRKRVEGPRGWLSKQFVFLSNH